MGSTPVERLVDDARLHASLDAIDAWRTATLGGVILVTDARDILANVSPPPGSNVIVDADPGPFHFGNRLAGVIRKYGLQSVVCLGGGSLPLFGASEFARLLRALADVEAITNNPYSSDLTAFNVSEGALSALGEVERDNVVARAFHERAGMAVEALPRNLATQFDLDTPSDVAVLALAHSSGAISPGPRLAAYLESLSLDLERYRSVLPLFTDQAKQIIVAGRVGTHAWSYLESETACRVRLFAEERGMEADGRDRRGEARSLLAHHLDAVGFERFFGTLAELGDAAFIDTRVLLAHNRIDASRTERFLSDLGQPKDIADPFLRDFTSAALAAPIPVLLGGHSLMSGDLMLLNELAWALREQEANAG